MKQDLIPSTARIEAFSDAVMAIIVTLLVLELKVPELAETFSSAEALTSLGHLMPKFLSFAMSFLVVAIFWVNHHHFFHRLKHSDRTMLWTNNLLLFWLCFIPFPTAFLGEHPFEMIPIMLYGLVLLLAALSFVVMHHHAYRHNLFHDNISKKFLHRENVRSLFAPILYLTAIISAWFSITIALIIFVIVPILYFMPAASIREE